MLRPASSTWSSTGCPGSGTNGCWSALITSRAVPPFWRASTNVPGTSIVRRTFGAADTSISVMIVALGTGAVGATAGTGATGRPTSGWAIRPPPFAAIASTRLPRSISVWP